MLSCAELLGRAFDSFKRTIMNSFGAMIDRSVIDLTLCVSLSVAFKDGYASGVRQLQGMSMVGLACAVPD